MSFLDTLLDFLLNFYGPGLYVFLFIVLLACGLGVPIPEDITLFCGGVLAYYGLTDLWGTIIVSFFGVMIGDSIVFYLGSKFGRRLTKKGIFKKLLNEDRLDMIQERFLLKHGNKMIFAARFMPGFRAPLFFSAGTLKVPFRIFIFYDGLAALLSVPAIVYLVYRYGNELEQVVKSIQSVEQAIVVGVSLIVFVALIRWLKNRNSSLVKLKKAIFLDRDGTINWDPGYLSDPEQLKLLPNVALALSRLKNAGYELVVISNQSGVSRGLIEPSAVPLIHERLNHLLESSASGSSITHFEYCEKLPEDTLSRRKPKPDLILDAAKKLHIDCTQSWMVGDRLSDVLAGKNANCKGTFLVKTGEGEDALRDLNEFKNTAPECFSENSPTKICADLLEVSDFILDAGSK